MLDVKVTESPWQNVFDPLAEMDTLGKAFTVTLVEADVFEHALLSVIFTEKLPLDFTLMLWVVAPEFHKYVFEVLEVKVTESPWQNVFDPLALMLGVAGLLLLVTLVLEDEAEQPTPLLMVTE